MSAPPPSPLARALFGWAFARRAGLFCAGLCAGAGALLVAAEYAHPREGLRLGFEEQPGFYAAMGAGAVAAAILAAGLLRWLLLRTAPYTDETDGGGKPDVDHA